MSFLRGMDDSDPLRAKPITREAGPEERRITRSASLGTGTLACPQCDAPVVLSESASPSDPLGCPFCAHQGVVHEFLSLAGPPRPARVEVRVIEPA